MTQKSSVLRFTMISIALISNFASAGQWGVGTAIGVRQATHKSIEHDISVVPLVTYSSERLDANLNTVSYSLFRSDEFLVAVKGELRLDGFKANDGPALTGLEERKPSLDVGLGLTRGGVWGVTELTVIADISGTHDGYEVRVQHQLPYRMNRLLISPAIGISRKNASLADYYYGVRPSEMTSTRPRYQAPAATNFFLSVNMGYAITDHLELLGGVQVTRLGNSITTSPLVDRKYEATVFSAVQYKF